MSGGERITIERRLGAPVEEIWELWTSAGGIESWWGPEGFSVAVRRLDLRPGGELAYAMTATAPPQIAFMEEAGMPLTTEALIVYREVDPPRRVAYEHLVDFVPGVAAYSVTTILELEPVDGGTRLVLTLDPMHDEEWTQRAAMGWESELGKLEAVIAVRRV